VSVKEVGDPLACPCFRNWKVNVSGTPVRLVAQTVVKNCAPPLPAIRPTAGRKTSVEANPADAVAASNRKPGAAARRTRLFMSISFLSCRHYRGRMTEGPSSHRLERVQMSFPRSKAVALLAAVAEGIASTRCAQRPAKRRSEAMPVRSETRSSQA
jgi:hypothetical protein